MVATRADGLTDTPRRTHRRPGGTRAPRSRRAGRRRPPPRRSLVGACCVAQCLHDLVRASTPWSVLQSGSDLVHSTAFKSASSRLPPLRVRRHGALAGGVGSDGASPCQVHRSDDGAGDGR